MNVKRKTLLKNQDNTPIDIPVFVHFNCHAVHLVKPDNVRLPLSEGLFSADRSTRNTLCTK